MSDTTMDLGDAFLGALDELGDAFLAALGGGVPAEGSAAGAPGGDVPADGSDVAGGETPADFDLVASLKEEAALSAWIGRAKARYSQVRAVNQRHLVAQERRAAGRTYTPKVDGVSIGTVTLKGKPREVVVHDPAAFAAWVRKHFPTEVTTAVSLGDVPDADAFVAWVRKSAPMPVAVDVTTTVRGAFQSKILKSLNAAETTTLTWPADKESGEVRELLVAGVKVINVDAGDRVHQITLDKKNGGADAAAAYFRDRGLDALVPGAEEQSGQ